VDMGGTSLKALVVDGHNKILALEKTPTDRSKRPDRLIADIAKLVEKAWKRAGLKRSKIRAVSIGAPGAVDHERGVVHAAPNLGWKEVPLAAKLRSLLRVPVLVDNDVNVGVVGEHVLGAGQGTGDLVGIFVGTGIGGGIIVKGKLYEGSRGGAGEIGHTVLMVNGPICSCGHRGCAEALASRTAMERDVRAAIKSGARSMVLEYMKARRKDRMTSSVIQAALKKKDKTMREVMARAESYLGILVANVVNFLDPERVVIGGGVDERLGVDFVGTIRMTAYKYFLGQRERPRVKILPGRLGDYAGGLGAVVLARQRLRGK